MHPSVSLKRKLTFTTWYLLWCNVPSNVQLLLVGSEMRFPRLHTILTVWNYSVIVLEERIHLICSYSFREKLIQYRL